jgi:hypothetical protein
MERRLPEFNFNIESLRNGNTQAPHLQYIHASLINQWQLEDFTRPAHFRIDENIKRVIRSVNSSIKRIHYR